MLVQKPCLAAVILVMATPGAALAGPALADDNAAAPSTTETEPTLPNQVEYGVGVRIRNVRAPKGLLELFVERSAGGVSSLGLGVDLVRRRGDVELQLGFEFEHIQPGEGVWIES